MFGGHFRARGGWHLDHSLPLGDILGGGFVRGLPLLALLDGTREGGCHGGTMLLQPLQSLPCGAQLLAALAQTRHHV